MARSQRVFGEESGFCLTASKVSVQIGGLRALCANRPWTFFFLEGRGKRRSLVVSSFWFFFLHCPLVSDGIEMNCIFSGKIVANYVLHYPRLPESRAFSPLVVRGGENVADETQQSRRPKKKDKRPFVE